MYLSHQLSTIQVAVTFLPDQIINDLWYLSNNTIFKAPYAMSIERSKVTLKVTLGVKT